MAAASRAGRNTSGTVNRAMTIVAVFAGATRTRVAILDGIANGPISRELAPGS
jgi:hypothetical protein